METCMYESTLPLVPGLAFKGKVYNYCYKCEGLFKDGKDCKCSGRRKEVVLPEHSLEEFDLKKKKEDETTLSTLTLVEDIKCTLRIKKIDEKRMETKSKEVEALLQEIINSLISSSFTSDNSISEAVKKSLKRKLLSHFFEMLNKVHD